MVKDGASCAVRTQDIWLGLERLIKLQFRWLFIYREYSVLCDENSRQRLRPNHESFAAFFYIYFFSKKSHICST